MHLSSHLRIDQMLLPSGYQLPRHLAKPLEDIVGAGRLAVTA